MFLFEENASQMIDKSDLIRRMFVAMCHKLSQQSWFYRQTSRSVSCRQNQLSSCFRPNLRAYSLHEVECKTKSSTEYYKAANRQVCFHPSWNMVFFAHNKTEWIKKK